MADFDLEAALQDLRVAYSAELPAKFDAMESLVLEFRNEQGTFKERYEGLFRVVHSLKGGAGMYGMCILSTVAHNMEDMMRRYDDHAGVLGNDEIDVWLKFVDLMRDGLHGIENGRKEFPEILRSLECLHGAEEDDIAPLKVMLVEPSRSFQSLCLNVLAELPVVTKVMEDGYVALNRLLNERFDILITAEELHGAMTGSALCAAVRLSQAQSKGVHAVLVTSNSRDDALDFPDFFAVLPRTIKLPDLLVETLGRISQRLATETALPQN